MVAPSEIWNWLPVFLEVAETSSAAGASRRLHVTPAAVSRTLGLLESQLGVDLFNRVGRQLVLNASGERLRDAVRSARRSIEYGLGEVFGDPYAGPLRVSSLGVLTESFVVPLLTALKARHPSVIPEHFNLGTTDANSLLLRGQLDVAFYYEQVQAEGIRVERLGALTASVYCGRTHPLFKKKRITRADLRAYPFSVPQAGETGRTLDGWPPDEPRLVGMRITMLTSNLHVGLSGHLLVVLPDVTAAPYLKERKLRRIPMKALPAIEVFAATADSGTGRAAVGDLVRALRQACASRTALT